MIAVVLILACVTLATGQSACPPDSQHDCLFAEDTSSASAMRGYRTVSQAAERALRQLSFSSTTALESLSDTESCDNDVLSDRNGTDSGGRKKRTVVRVKAHLGKACEPCQPRVRYLVQFFRYCYVIAPFYQWVRYVSCPGRCDQPCWCSNTRCFRTRFARVFFFSWCIRSPGFGFRQGLNYRYLWLPQDCSCREVQFDKIF